MADELAATIFPLVINGKSVKARSFAVVQNPSNGTAMGKMPLATKKDINAAVAAAKKAFATLCGTRHTALDVGLMHYRTNGRTDGPDEVMFVSGGFAEVRDNTVRVVSEAGERPVEIDEARAREAEARARERLSQDRVLGGERRKCRYRSSRRLSSGASFPWSEIRRAAGIARSKSCRPLAPGVPH